MPIQNIQVKDFQSIKQAKVEFGAFTVFTGPSSSGKSAFMRAAEALIRNNFSPSQVRQGAKETHLVLTVDEHVVEAVRGKSKSTYILDGVQFTKCGRAVPDAIGAVLSVPKIADVESTFTTQFDKPYLLADPGATAARVLGSLTNVSLLYASMREANRRSLEVNSDIKAINELIDVSKSQLEEFSDLPSKISQLDIINHITNDIKQDMQVLRELGQAIEDTDKNLSLLEDIITISAESLSSLDIAMQSASKLQQEYAELTDLLTSIDALTESIPTIDYSILDEIDIDSLCAEASVVSNFSSTLENVDMLFDSLEESTERISKINVSVHKKQEEYDTLLIDIGTCPVCGQSTDGDIHGAR